jgi:hypothetical protein
MIDKMHPRLLVRRKEPLFGVVASLVCSCGALMREYKQKSPCPLSRLTWVQYEDIIIVRGEYLRYPWI